jgi:glycosyltransferase involved in cell wall biosynthesis
MLDALDPDSDVEVWVPDDLAHPAEEMALCTLLRARGVRVRHLGLPIMRRAYQTPRGLLGLFGRFCRLVRELRAARPRLVYCTTSAALLGAPAARLARVSRVVGHFQEVWSGAEAHILAGAARACHLLVANSEAVTNALPPDLRKRTVVVPNGTPEPDQVIPLAGRSGDLLFLMASRWTPTKGYRTLLDAWDRAGAPGQLTILGGMPLSGDSVDVPELVSNLRHPERVHVEGEVTDIASYVEAADVVLVPSDKAEGFGLVAVEAFARARPVIGSAAGGLLGILDSGMNGWLFPAGDAEALSGLLAGLTRDEVNRAGERARTTYEERFTAQRFAQNWRHAVFGAPRET